MRPIAKCLLFLALVLPAAYLVRSNYVFAVQLAGVTADREPGEHLLDHFYPGTREAVLWLRDAAPETIYLIRNDQHRRVHQRLLEMLYPLRPAPYRPGALLPGDLVVLDAERELEVPAVERFKKGWVRIVQVQ